MYERLQCPEWVESGPLRILCYNRLELVAINVQRGAASARAACGGGRSPAD
jgi:hypothetical protein